MDAEIGHSDQLFRLLGWLEVNWRRLAAVASALVLVGIVVAYVVWRGKEKEKAASQALSRLLISDEALSADALLKLAEVEAGTQAASRAVLLAAGRLFADGKYQEAQAQFEKFLQAAPDPSLLPEARLGIAACKEARGETEAALAGYKSLVDDPASGNVLPQARFALARLYEAQGQIELARPQYEVLARERASSLASEAAARLAELPPAPSISSSIPVIGTSVSTNQP